MIFLEFVLKTVFIALLFQSWFLALLLVFKLIFNIPGSAFSRDKQCKFDGGDDFNET